MIANQCFTKEWVIRKKQEMGSVDPALLEKSIHAFALLCGLGGSPMSFVFKGGTSMILLLREFRRLSVDIVPKLIQKGYVTISPESQIYRSGRRI